MITFLAFVTEHVRKWHSIFFPHRKSRSINDDTWLNNIVRFPQKELYTFVFQALVLKSPFEIYKYSYFLSQTLKHINRFNLHINVFSEVCFAKKFWKSSWFNATSVCSRILSGWEYSSVCLFLGLTFPSTREMSGSVNYSFVTIWPLNAW